MKTPETLHSALFARVSNERGIAAVVALLLTLLLSVLSVAAIRTSTTEVTIASNDRSNKAMLAVADAGLQRGVNAVLYDLMLAPSNHRDFRSARLYVPVNTAIVSGGNGNADYIIAESATRRYVDVENSYKKYFLALTGSEPTEWPPRHETVTTSPYYKAGGAQAPCYSREIPLRLVDTILPGPFDPSGSSPRYSVSIRYIQSSGACDPSLAASGSYEAKRVVLVATATGPAAGGRQLEAIVRFDNVSVWNNAVFGGVGAGDYGIRGNVRIAGSVHVLGNNLDLTDDALDLSGTAGVRNNYADMPAVLRMLVPDPPKVGGEETLESKLRVKRGEVLLSGTATVGVPNDPANGVKDTVDGSYVTSGFGGNQGEKNVYSDNGSTNKYDLGNKVSFPVIDVESALNITNPAQCPGGPTPSGGKVVLDANLSGFTCSDANGNSISWTPPPMGGGGKWGGDAQLSITGVVTVGNNTLVLGDNSKCGSLGIRYSTPENAQYPDGGGTLYSEAVPAGAFSNDTAGIFIHSNILPMEGKKFASDVDAERATLGLMAAGDIGIATGPGDSQLTLAAAMYARRQISSPKQSQIAGTMVANYIDMGTNVPRIYQVPSLVKHVPPSLPGRTPIFVPSSTSWRDLAF
jgi:hypothetical protein